MNFLSRNPIEEMLINVLTRTQKRELDSRNTLISHIPIPHPKSSSPILNKDSNPKMDTASIPNPPVVNSKEYEKEEIVTQMNPLAK